MKVSVVIPVYNAAAYVEQAVASALAQPETGDVLLVEDGSEDSSLAVCQRLARQHKSVRLLRHPAGQNQGKSVSRNLGIARAQCALIAFLDADDYFLPTRFEKVMEVFASHSDADGVYEETELFFQDESSRQRWKEAGWPKRIGLRRAVDPDHLLETLLEGGAGSFCTDGIVVRRSIFEKTGYFNLNLRTGEDTHLWIRMAALGRLYPGRTDRPVSMCRVHAGNRVTGRSLKDRRDQKDAVQRVWGDLLCWCRAKRVPVRSLHLLARRYVSASNWLVMQQHLFDACWGAMRSCEFLIRNCPQPWRIEGFFHLLGAALFVGLASQRVADYVKRGMYRPGRSG
jgi:glycosyltransferase involved in cell wall biosynthesis